MFVTANRGGLNCGSTVISSVLYGGKSSLCFDLPVRVECINKYWSIYSNLYLIFVWNELLEKKAKSKITKLQSK